MLFNRSKESSEPVTPVGVSVVVDIGFDLSSLVPGTMSIIEVVVEVIFGLGLIFLGGEKLVAGSEGVVSFESSDFIGILGFMSVVLSGMSLLVGVVDGVFGAISGGLSGSSGIGSDVVKVDGRMSGGVGLCALSSSIVLFPPSNLSGLLSIMLGLGENVGIMGGMSSGLSIFVAGFGDLFSPVTGMVGVIGSFVPGMIGPFGSDKKTVSAFFTTSAIEVPAVAPSGISASVPAAS